MNSNEPAEFESLCEPIPVRITMGEFELAPAFQALLKGTPEVEFETGDTAPHLPNERKPQEPGSASAEAGS